MAFSEDSGVFSYFFFGSLSGSTCFSSSGTVLSTVSSPPCVGLLLCLVLLSDYRVLSSVFSVYIPGLLAGSPIL